MTKHHGEPRDCPQCLSHAAYALCDDGSRSHIDNHLQEYQRRHDGAISKHVREELMRDMGLIKVYGASSGHAYWE